MTPRPANNNSHFLLPPHEVMGPSCASSRARHNLNHQAVAKTFDGNSVLFRDGTIAASAWHKLHNQRDHYDHEAAYERSSSYPVQVMHASLRGFSVPSSISVVAFRGGSSCVQYSADRSRVPERSTDKNCRQFRNRNNRNKNKLKGRTEMSAASTGIESTSPISRDLHGPTKPNFTSRISRASIPAHVVGGLRATTNHQLKHSASFSPR